MIGFAAAFGLLAVFVAQNWLNSQAVRTTAADPQLPQPQAKTIVVAKQPLRFGARLEAGMLREVLWPANELPDGAFGSIGDLMRGGERLTLTAIEPNEPVLAVKITGAGQRATLSALVQPGMKAVTIRVNDVEGVGGFVLPGDRVDIILTRNKGDNVSSEVVLQNSRVLAVDQSADERASKAAVARSVTLEVGMTEAQKVGLAASVGTLSLVLRKAGESAEVKTRRVSLKDLVLGNNGEDGETTTVVVTRATSKQEYSVRVEEAGIKSAGAR
jgi:pilus assembly protein CpaB